MNDRRILECMMDISAQDQTIDFKSLSIDEIHNMLDCDRESCTKALGEDLSRVLDVGTGSGMTAVLLARRDVHVVAIDSSDDKLAEAQANAFSASCEGNIEFIKANARKLPFSDGEFDGVIAYNLMHHLKNYEQAISEAARVVKVGGTVVLAELSAEGRKAVSELHERNGGEKHEAAPVDIGVVQRAILNNGLLLSIENIALNTMWVCKKPE